MTETANSPIPVKGTFRRAFTYVQALMATLDSGGFDYTLDRVERLEAEVGRLKEEVRRIRDPGAVDHGRR